jgi:hypothetical protein
MPTIDELELNVSTRAIVLGHSGAGKSGALLSLAVAGYTLWIFDFEGKWQIIKTLIRDMPHYQKVDPKKINILTIMNDFTAFGGKVQPQSGGWTKFLDATASWDKPRVAGAPHFIYTLGAEDVIVLDTASGMADLCRDHCLALNSRAGQIPEWKEYNQMQEMTDTCLRSICCKSTKAHVIMNAHVKKTREGGQVKDNPKNEGATITVGGRSVGFPRTTGATMAQSIGRHFNDILFLDQEPGIGGKTNRFFSTVVIDEIRTKSSAPGAVKPRYPIETGLADFFRDVQEGKGK